MKEIDLSIIIVNYNTKDLTVACLESILKNVKGITYEVIVVDNGSQDGSVEIIQNSKFKIQNDNSKFKIIQNSGNLGFSRANNAGVKESSGRYVLFLNSDTVVYKDSLEKMVEFMDRHKDAAAATCYVELPNGKLDDAAHRGFPTPWNAFCHFSGIAKIFPKSTFFNGYHLGWRDLDKVHEIDSLAGAFMLVRRVSGEQVGWWDEDYFFYGEDIDFCYMLKKRGGKIYFVPDVKVLHYKGMSSGIKEYSSEKSKASPQTRKWATDQRFKAMELFYKKHYMNHYPKFLTWFVLQGIAMKRYLAFKNKNIVAEI